MISSQIKTKNIPWLILYSIRNSYLQVNALQIFVLFLHMRKADNTSRVNLYAVDANNNE